MRSALPLVLLGFLLAPGARAQPPAAGDIDRTAIRDVIRRHIPRMRACYERALAGGRPGLAGRVAVSFTILPVGKVGSATLRDSELGDEQAEACILATFMSMRFPRHPGPGAITITYPMIFRAEDPAAAAPAPPPAPRSRPGRRISPRRGPFPR